MPNWVSNPSAVLPNGQAITPALAMTRSNGLAIGEERVGAGAHARERGEIELHQLEPAAICGVGANLCSRGLGLREIARRADDFGAMRR